MDKVEITTEETGPDAPAKADAPAAGERPAWCPEKFWKADGTVDNEGLAKSYGELEAARTKPAQTPEEKAAADAAKVAAPAASSIPGVSAETTARATAELTDGGELTAETYAELLKAGYSKEIVDNYVRGTRADEAAAAQTVTEMKGITGGDDQYAAMVGWMQGTLTPAEIAGYNTSMNSRNNAVIELAVRGMYAKYATVNGHDPKLLGGRTGGSSVGDAYESAAQLTKDQRNPLYKSDEAFRRRVEEKLGRSNIL